MRRLICLSILLLLTIDLPTLRIPSVWGGGPLVITETGVPYVWNNSSDIPYNPDLGDLGMLTNTEAVALVSEAFAAWATSSIETAQLSFINAGALTIDVDTLQELSDVTGVCDGKNPIVFDTNGKIVDDLLGLPDVIGFAGVVCISSSPNPPFRITKGSAVLNGRFIDGIDTPTNPELTEPDFTAVFKHEFGHFLNLDHSQVNGHYFLDDTDDPGFVEFGAPPLTSIELMFPLLIEGAATDPVTDDIAAISTLYPSSDFFSSTGTITGSISESDGTTLFQGANVIARNVNDPFFDAVSNVSGVRYCQPGRDTCVLVTGTAPPELEGLYEINGLTSGASYSVEIVNVNPEFTDGSSIGPFLTPVMIPGPEEFYNGANEASTDPPDDPSLYTEIAVASTVTDINIVINGAAPIISVTPISQDFGSVTVGSSADRTFTVQNVGQGTVAGSATTAAPFSIVSGGTYNLTAGQSQTVTVRFSAITPGIFNGTVDFTGGGGASATVTGTASEEGGDDGGGSNGGGGGGCGGFGLIEGKAEPPGTALGFLATLYLPLLLLFIRRRLRNRISARPS